ncbi:PREDICTED: aspartic proteinase nepenthesin-1-like [Fragaria vesca subsp. vesca]
MAAALARFSLLTFFLALNTLYVTANPATISTITKPKRFVTKLIHHDSVLSPYYNPNANIRDLVSRSVKSSAARLAYLKAKSTNAFVVDDTRARVVPENPAEEFMANFSFGEPPVPQLLAMDTGSDLLWIQCLPCTKCFKQSSPIFDPSKSSTYKILPCISADCILSNPAEKCNFLNQCRFNQTYLDGTSAEGLIATEKLTFVTSNEGPSPVYNAVFGCGHINAAADEGQISGVLGLGPSQISLSTKIGYKFSYCSGSIRDPNYPHNQLILGEGTKTEGAATPLEIVDELYHLTLEGISLGQSRLQIDPKVFSRVGNAGGTVIDSGTTISYLVKAAYGGVDLVMDKTSFFEVTGDDEFCMAVQMADGGTESLNVIGILAQQNYNVAYDLAAKKVYFQKIDCGLL